MKRVVIRGIGAVSPAGWSLPAFRQTLERDVPLATQQLDRPGWTQTLPVRRVPPPVPQLPFLSDARMRRSPPIARFVVASALEALGADRTLVMEGKLRLGVVICTMCGCVLYSRRFYHEVLHQPALASPLLFPETVFNAPGSHLAALLRSAGLNYTIVGDQGTIGTGLALAANWLLQEQVDGCLVVGAEELDWMMADAMRMFARRVILSEGAGALYLRLEDARNLATSVATVTSAQLYRRGSSRETCIRNMRAQLPPMAPGEFLCDGWQGKLAGENAETRVWRDWPGPRCSPLRILGDGLVAGAAWQVIAAVDALDRESTGAATVSLVGCNEQAIGLRFERG